MDFLNGLVDDHKRSEDKPPHPSHENAGDHLLQRLISGDSQAATANQSQHPPTPPKQSDSLFDMIGGALSGRKSPPAPPPEPENLFDKIGDVLKGNPKPPQNKPEGLVAQVGDTLNNALGGGAKGEAQEDHLDKAIDFVQEYILKQGDQNNESAIEQIKDKQIAGAIRQGYERLTGK